MALELTLPNVDMASRAKRAPPSKVSRNYKVIDHVQCERSLLEADTRTRNRCTSSSNCATFLLDVSRFKLTLFSSEQYHSCATTESCANYRHTLASEMEVLRRGMISVSFDLMVKRATLRDKQVMATPIHFQTLIDLISSQETPSLSHLYLYIDRPEWHLLSGDCGSLLSRLLDLLPSDDQCLVFFVMECIAMLLKALRTQNIRIQEMHRFRIVTSLLKLAKHVDPHQWPFTTAFALLCAQTHLSGALLPSQLVLEVTARLLRPNILEETLPVAVWLDVLREWIDGVEPGDEGDSIAKVDSIHQSLLRHLLGYCDHLEALFIENSTLSRLIRTLTSLVPKTKMALAEIKVVLNMASASLLQHQLLLIEEESLHVCLFALRCIEMTSAEVFFILTRIGAQAPLAIDWARTGPCYQHAFQIHKQYAHLLRKAIDQAKAALLPPENADPLIVLPTLTQTLRKHLAPLLRPNWLDRLLIERERLNANGKSVVEHWCDLSATLLSPFIINPLINALKVPKFRSSIQLDDDDGMVPTFNTEFMPRNSSNSLPQMTQVEHLIRQELRLGHDTRITYLLCRDLDTAIQNLQREMLDWDADFGRSHCRSLFPHLNEIGWVCANACTTTMVPIIGFIWPHFIEIDPDLRKALLDYYSLYTARSTVTIADKQVSLIHIKDWDGMKLLRSFEKFVLFVHPEHLCQR